jgi:hypothetical protein
MAATQEVAVTGRTLSAGIPVIDVDTHLTEPHDLWTSRAPRGWEERVPRVTDVDGTPTWVFDGNVLGRAGASVWSDPMEARTSVPGSCIGASKRFTPPLTT